MLDEDNFTPSHSTHTMMTCGQEAIAQQEKRCLRALGRAHRFAVGEERLTIWYDDGQGVLSWIESD